MIAAAEPPTTQPAEPQASTFQVTAALRDRGPWSSRADEPLAPEFAFALYTGVCAKRVSGAGERCLVCDCPAVESYTRSDRQTRTTGSGPYETAALPTDLNRTTLVASTHRRNRANPSRITRTPAT